MDESLVRLKCSRRLDEMLRQLDASPSSIEMLRTVTEVTSVLKAVIPKIGLEEAQNTCFALGRCCYAKMLSAAAADRKAAEWKEDFEELAGLLNVAVPQFQMQEQK